MEATIDSRPAVRRIGILTFLKFLIGDRESIRAIAAAPNALWVGLLFVFSAGFAREYDGESLLHEPWHLLIPLVASLTLSFFLYSIVWQGSTDIAYDRPEFPKGYRSFLTLFWMTAPLAWLYAIPFERFFDADGAVFANVRTLAVVSAWRVLLITRVLSVLSGRWFSTTFVIVLTFSWIVMGIAMMVLPLPIIQFMGGIRLSESELLLSNIRFTTLFFGFFAMIVLIPGSLSCLIWSWSRWERPTGDSGPRVSMPLWCLAVVAVLVWAPILPKTQPEQQRRLAVERLLRANKIDEGLDYMAARPREDFPRLWDPPPRPVYGLNRPDTLDVLERIHERKIEGWVREVYLRKLQREYLQHYFVRHVIDSDEWKRIQKLLDKMPEGAALLAEAPEAVEYMEQIKLHAATTQSGTRPTGE